MCPPGEKCSLCYTVFSVWGILMLIILGILYSVKYEKVDNGAVVEGEQGRAALSSFIAAAFYLLCFGGCLARFIWIRVKSSGAEKYNFEPADA